MVSMILINETGEKTTFPGSKYAHCPTHIFYHEGVAVGSFVTYDETSIWSVCIKPEYQGLGFGTQMMRELVELYGKTQNLILHVYKDNEAAIHVYEKAGFVITEEYFETAWTMERMAG